MSNKNNPLPELMSASFHFEQESNTNGTTGNEGEGLTIECESPLGISFDSGCYFVLKTEGWSIDDSEEIADLLARIEGAIQVVINNAG